MTKSGLRVELEMAYKQIEKLNDVLMEKEKQINYLLNQMPSSDKVGKGLGSYEGRGYGNGSNNGNTAKSNQNSGNTRAY